jgi:hypothetical protein
LKIFLCWSGERGEKLAGALKEWMVGAVPGLAKEDVFLSTELAKGSEWFNEVRARLASVNAAVICLTPETAQSPWVHFEAGVVLGRVGAEAVFPYLFGVRPEELQGPLNAFQATVNDEADTRRLAQRLCEMAGAELPPDYGEHWERLRSRMVELRLRRLSDVIPNFAALFQRKTFDEALKDCTHQTWADRYAGARETKKVLEGSKEVVARVCEPHETEFYSRLISAVDAYADLIKNKLLVERQFFVTEAPEVDFTRTPGGKSYRAGAAIFPMAESRMRQIKELVRLLDTPGVSAPTD